MRTFLRPILFLVFILLSVSLACSAVTGGGNNNDMLPVNDGGNDNPPLELPTPVPSRVQPTVEQPEIIQPTLEAPTLEVPTVGPQKFYKEEFDANTNIENWSYFTTGPGGDDSNLVIEQKGEGLNFDLGALDLYVYYLYEGETYEDVALTLVAENQGVNNNNVSLVCRLDYDNSEWYEFSFESGGVWFLYAYQDGYNTLDNGGSNKLNQGKATNEYGMTCEGNTIAMYINGEKIKEYNDRNYNFGEGQVGFNISSLNVLPVTVEVHSFDIAEP